MIRDYLRSVILRDLETVRAEVEAYEDEADLWAMPGGVPNSGGTLALHLAGNLAHYIGARLGGSGYVRDREAEFGDRAVPKGEILTRIDSAIAAVREAFEGLDEDRLRDPFPEEVAGTRLTTGLFLTHLATHLGYHLGQLDYHRRVVTGQTEGVGAQSVKALGG